MNNEIVSYDEFNIDEDKIKKTLSKKKKREKDKIVPINNMDKGIYNINKSKVIKEGKEIYRENEYIAKIWDIMNDNTFSAFFDKYLKNYSDIQVSMVFFNLYKTIEEEYIKTFNRKIIKEEMVYMLRYIMRDNFMRKYFIQDANNKNIISLNKDIITQDVINTIKLKNKILL